MDNNTTDHGNEPARFPCIETEKALSRAQGLLKHLQNNLPEIWMRDQAKVIQHNLEIARESFREVLQHNRDSRARLISLAATPEVTE